MIRFRKEKGYSTAPYSVNISLTEKCPLRCIQISDMLLKADMLKNKYLSVQE